jgi:multiple sugar transport system substrate-binding protein
MRGEQAVSARPRRDRRTRRGAPLLAVLTLCLLGSACTSGGEAEPSPSAAPTTSSSSASPGPVTLRFAVYGEPAVVAAYRQLAATYTAEHPGVTVKVEAAADAVTAEDHLDRGFDAGTPPDLFLTRQTSLSSLVAQDRVQPVDQLLEKRGVQFGDNYQRLGLEAFAGDSALQCMPNDVSPYVVFYNKRLLVPRMLAQPGKAAPNPQRGWRWDQFVDGARQMSQNGVDGVYLAPKLTTLMPLVRSAGEDLVDDPRLPTTLTLSDEGTRKALEEVLTVARDPSITPRAKQLAHQDAVTRFENGRLGMMIGTRALVPRLREKPDLHFDVYPLPSLGRSRTLADMTGLCMSKDTEHVDETADFLAYASGDEASEVLAATGAIVPANVAALHSPAFTDPGKFPRNSQVFDGVIRRADSMPSSPGWPDVVSQTQPLLDRMFYAPVIDLDTLLPRIDELSAGLLATASVTPSPSADPS